MGGFTLDAGPIPQPDYSPTGRTLDEPVDARGGFKYIEDRGLIAHHKWSLRIVWSNCRLVEAYRFRGLAVLAVRLTAVWKGSIIMLRNVR